MMTPTQAQVSAICATILGLDRVELDDDLYVLGSDSHQAVLVALEVERTFDVSLPLELMETAANVRALSAWVDERKRAEAPGSGPGPIDGARAG